MTEDQSSIDPRPKSWIDKIAQVFSDEPTDTNSLLELLRNAEQDSVLDADALSIIEGALQVSSMQVKDIMIPRSKVVTVPLQLPPKKVIELVSNSSHSRLPVVGENVDDVKGILLAKDLLAVSLNDDAEEINIADIARPVTFVSENKRLNVLLKEFRETRRHMAVVTDEYGSICGIVTIEDVLEQIVGDIEDETDIDEENHIKRLDKNNYIVKAHTPLNDFNSYFQTDFSDQEFSTIGGLVIQKFGKIPERGETVVVEPFLITVLNADNRQIKLIKVTSDSVDISKET
ncbi:CBS domain-containing protein [Gammaproteobacteria bacterium]|nr:CBS domain-containing protein [Gammaproteobacteria bacterium]